MRLMYKIAPVLILTCNRQKKLEQLVNSLANCELAKETELFISVDYPPRDEYVDGWKKVCSYLELLVQGDSNFRKIKVFKQEKNIGPEESVFFLERMARKEFEYAIISEDDNSIQCGVSHYAVPPLIILMSL